MYWKKYTCLADCDIQYLRDTVYKLPKDAHVVAAGVYKGGDVMSMYNKRPDLHFTVFDSFKGLAVPKVQDSCEDQCSEGECNAGGLNSFIQGFKDVGIYDHINIKTNEVWITVENIKKFKIAPVDFLWLDLDHYEPTFAMLEICKNLLKPNSIVATHDYDFFRCPGIRKACHEVFPNWKVQPNTGIAQAKIKKKRFFNVKQLLRI
ncbi:hypothetical protein [Endozoicomonas sp. ALC066]|uniref:hypothetical protein n=1 Tax=Endozoicomonas sp. ALC066 TaxID=3403078 RepID=UPI003BB5AE64